MACMSHYISLTYWNWLIQILLLICIGDRREKRLCQGLSMLLKVICFPHLWRTSGLLLFDYLSCHITKHDNLSSLLFSNSLLYDCCRCITLLHQFLNSIKKGSTKEACLASRAIGLSSFLFLVLFWLYTFCLILNCVFPIWRVASHYCRQRKQLTWNNGRITSTPF